MKKISKIGVVNEGLKVNLKNLITMDELVKENRRLTKQNAFLSKQNTWLKKGLNPKASFDLINRVGSLAGSNQRLAQRVRDLERDLESELTYRDWGDLREAIGYDFGNEATVKRLNDWIKNSDNPLRYELLLELICDLDDIPAIQRLRQKAEVKLALLRKGLDVARETMPENMIGYTSDSSRPLQWRDELGRFMDAAKEANPVLSKSVIRRLAAQKKEKTK